MMATPFLIEHFLKEHSSKKPMAEAVCTVTVVRPPRLASAHVQNSANDEQPNEMQA